MPPGIHDPSGGVEMAGVLKGRRRGGLTFSSQLDIPQHGSTCLCSTGSDMCCCHTSTQNGTNLGVHVVGGCSLSIR